MFCHTHKPFVRRLRYFVFCHIPNAFVRRLRYFVFCHIPKAFVLRLRRFLTAKEFCVLSYPLVVYSKDNPFIRRLRGLIDG